MFILNNLIVALAEIVDIILLGYIIIIFARAIISWVNPDPYNKIVIFLYRFTEPVLQPIRKILPLPMRNIGIDFSPIIVVLVLYFLRLFLVPTIRHLASLF
ncbi:MAG: YggT family protein [Syntrophaceae bacterium]|nr:YggT family protein [Syntrophaceae bacterium]